MIYSNQPLSQVGARFNAGRAFDVEDDVEFCPALSEEEVNLYRYGMLDSHGSPNHNLNSLSTSAQTTPPHSTAAPDYYYSSGSSGGSPISRAGGAVLASGGTYYYNTGNNGMSGPSSAGGVLMMGGPAVASTPVRRRPVDIIDPMTGSNVSSPIAGGGYYSTPHNSSSASGSTVYYTANNSTVSNGSPMRGNFSGTQYPVSAGVDTYGTSVRGRAW
ncbi:conserved fungal protein [Sugiyamaella lignohabitans]|uniref:Conserved fungal protein n=1 Tax=Sugiyamaella lignohabitans TaxID=796027 RepID=A0A167E2C0_9ASCO|nr:uncharacterized protein AWJ20_1857 [Sugiyamaella lignohabitans]ANB13561.1 conserved fungal protein [Sugiyamaella lignohabitans]